MYTISHKRLAFPSKITIAYYSQWPTNISQLLGRRARGWEVRWTTLSRSAPTRCGPTGATPTWPSSRGSPRHPASAQPPPPPHHGLVVVKLQTGPHFIFKQKYYWVLSIFGELFLDRKAKCRLKRIIIKAGFQGRIWPMVSGQGWELYTI
jgi:hypothetical protein